MTSALVVLSRKADENVERYKYEAFKRGKKINKRDAIVKMVEGFYEK